MVKKVALLIGVSEYGEGIPSLSAPRNDVIAMKQVLENPRMGGFDNVTILPDPDLVDMQKAIQQIFDNCSRDDLVLLFFSGHGITDDNNSLYLATKGTAKDFYQATSVPASFIQRRSFESRTRRQVIVLDCCYSGAFAEGWQAKGARITLKQLLGGEGRVVLTSSTATQTSFQQEGEELSLYTKYFVEGIETGAADQDEDGKIYTYELHQYAKTKVQEEKPTQKPGIIIDREGYKILLSQAPVSDPELDFRKLVEQYATEGQVIPAAKYLLRVKRQELGIAKERADEIVDKVLAPYRKRLENIKLYKDAFTEEIERNYPLIEEQQHVLQKLQDILGLEYKDISQVKKEVLAEKELEDQEPKRTSQSSQMTAEEFLNSGLDKRKKGDNQGAIKDFTKAIELKPDYADAYYNRAIFYKIQGYKKTAIEDYTKAIKLKPDYADAYNNRGSAYYELEKYQKAISDYSKAIELKPDYANAYYNRAVFYKFQGYEKTAIEDYQKAAEFYQQQGNTEWYQNTINNIKELEQ